jgi:hypothetical protein
MHESYERMWCVTVKASAAVLTRGRNEPAAAGGRFRAKLFENYHHILLLSMVINTSSALADSLGRRRCSFPGKLHLWAERVYSTALSADRPCLLVDFLCFTSRSVHWKLLAGLGAERLYCGARSKMLLCAGNADEVLTLQQTNTYRTT